MSKSYMSKNEKGLKLITTDGKYAHLTTQYADRITHDRLDLIHEDEEQKAEMVDIELKVDSKTIADIIKVMNSGVTKEEATPFPVKVGEPLDEEAENEYRVDYENDDDGVVYQDVKATQAELETFVDECNGVYHDFVTLGNVVFKKSRLVKIMKL